MLHPVRYLFLTAALLAVAASLLTGCGGSGGNADTSATQSASPPKPGVPNQQQQHANKRGD